MELTNAKVLKVLTDLKKEITNAHHLGFLASKQESIQKCIGKVDVLVALLEDDSLPLNNKRCQIINSRFSWIMRVDGHDISFQGSDNAEYFKNHYISLGYAVEMLDEYRRGDNG
jgi:hypothetical protein